MNAEISTREKEGDKKVPREYKEEVWECARIMQERHESVRIMGSQKIICWKVNEKEHWRSQGRIHWKINAKSH